MQHFNQLFDQLSDKEKIEYLFNLLNNNQSLKNNFTGHFMKLSENIRINSKEVFNMDEMIETILSESDDLKEILSELDFEETDWSRWSDTEHYVPEYEIANIVAEEEAIEVFESYNFDLKFELGKGNLLDIAKQLIIIFHGAMQSEINDPYNNLSDSPDGFFVYIANNCVEDYKAKLSQREFTTDDYQNTFDLIFTFNKLKYADTDNYLRSISQFLETIISDEPTAQMAWDSIIKHKTPIEKVPQLANSITSLLNNQQLWLKTLENCFLQEYETTKELMDYYYLNDKDKFEEKAPLVYEKHEHHSLKYLMERVAKGTEFHIKLLKKTCSFYDDDITNFNELRKHLPKSEISDFIDSLHNANVKAGLLIHENRLNDLILLINKEHFDNKNSFKFFNFQKSLVALFVKMPDTAWEMIRKEIISKMKFERTRNGYAYIAQLLTDAKIMKSKAPEINSMITALYNNRPNLPALKDELKKAGLM